MAVATKYADLPDIDLAPDVYETPDLTDGSTTTATTSDLRPGSSQSSEDESAFKDNLVHKSLDPNLARNVFDGSRVDAKNSDFTDRIDRQREAYRVTRSRRRHHQDDGEESSESEDDETSTTPETIQRRAAKLQRQALKLQADFARLRGQQSAKGEASGEEQLEQLLASLHVSRTENGAFVDLTERLASKQQLGQQPGQEALVSQRSSNGTRPAPEIAKLDAFADLDARLASIERSLGLGAIESGKDNSALDTPLLPQLEILHKQITLLSNTSPTSLDSLSSKIKGLTSDADALETARKRAKNAQISTSRSSVGPDTFARRKSGFARDGTSERSPDPGSALDSEDQSQLSAIYRTLPTIEKLAPMLSPMLERLRSLNLIHAEAGNAASRLGGLQTRQVEMDDELKACTEAVAKIEKVVLAREDGLKENLKVVEDWVKELEGRVSALS